MKKPAHRGAKAGLSNRVRQDRFEKYAPTETPRQAPYLISRFGLTPSMASVVAELAFAVTDRWGRA
ncbi:hypothetical protein CCS92_06750 [Methylobacterium radiotolerans]|jgi:hypothetical protein|nr:hypothetical protein CCS92_06750 [Methylobacterium radiotolerans]